MGDESNNNEADLVDSSISSSNNNNNNNENENDAATNNAAEVAAAAAPAPAAEETQQQREQTEREQVLDDYRAKIREHREVEARLKRMREDVKGLGKRYQKTEDDLSALQSVGQIIGDVLKRFDNINDYEGLTTRSRPNGVSHASFGRGWW